MRSVLALLFGAPEVCSEVSHFQLAGYPLDSGDRSGSGFVLQPRRFFARRDDFGRAGLRPATPASSPAFFECRHAQTRIWLRLCCSAGQTIIFRRLLGWAAGPRNFMKIRVVGRRNRLPHRACACRGGAGGFACPPWVAGAFSTLLTPERSLGLTGHRRRWSVPPCTAVAYLRQAGIHFQPNPRHWPALPRAGNRNRHESVEAG